MKLCGYAGCCRPNNHAGMHWRPFDGRPRPRDVKPLPEVKRVKP